MRIGFNYYDTIPRVGSTTQEILLAMTGGQKVAVLDAFKTGTGIGVTSRRVMVPRAIIKHLYKKLKEVETMARKCMRGEIVVNPGDPAAEPPVPPIYNTPPSTSTALINAIKDLFVDDFASGEVTAILTAIVKYSKHDGTANWDFYKNNIIV